GGAPVGGAGLFTLAAGLDARAALAAGLTGPLVDPVVGTVAAPEGAGLHQRRGGGHQRAEVVVGELLALGPRVAAREEQCFRPPDGRATTRLRPARGDECGPGA